jgi:hypothetical protein
MSYLTRETTYAVARLIVVGFVSNGLPTADRMDPGTLGVVAFDTTAPQLLSDFAHGAL